MPVKNLITLGIGASPGSIAPFILMGLGVSPGSPSPATLLDVSHAWQLVVDGTDRWQNTIDGSVAWTEYEAGEIGTLRFILKETGAALGVSEWQEVVLKDGSDAIWGGYIVNATPLADRMGNSNRLSWEITAESYATVLNRTARVRRSYTGVNPGDVLVDLFDRALDSSGEPPNQTEFDTATYVTTGTWPDAFTFAANGEKLTDILDRLALLAGYVWWIDADKAVHFGVASASTAPFGIKLAGAADYASFFPPNANSVNARIDATDIRNRITVNGGVRVSAVQTETYYGDGATLIYTVTQFPIVEVITISVGGVIQSFGTDWYHSFADYDCLVNYSHGTVRWNSGNEPPNLDAIIIRYRYGERVVVTVTDNASVAQYGRVFDYEVTDHSITTAATATAVANAILEEFAYGILTGGFDVNRLGIKAGQRVQIEYTALGLTGYYQARQVAGAIRPGGLVTLAVRFGGRQVRLSNFLQGSVGGGPVTGGGMASGSGAESSLPGATARDQYGLQLTVPDYGATERDEITAGSEALHIRFKNASDQVLHRIDAYSDETSTGEPRETLIVNAGGGVVDKRGYTLLQTVAQREAHTRLRAVGGYGDAGQQDASLHLYAWRKDGLWDHSRTYLDTDTVQVKPWAESAAPDPGTDSLPDGLLVYTDGTWDPGSGEGWYMRINAAWRPIAVVAGAVMQIGATLDLLDYHLRSVGNLEFANANTQQSNFTAGANTVYFVGTGSGNVTATLPVLSGISDSDVRLYIFIKVSSDGNQMIIDGDGSETINGATTQSTTTQYTVFRVMSRGTEWLLW